MLSADDDLGPARSEGSRRGFLKRLAAAAGALLLGPGAAALAGLRDGARGPGLSESDRLIASVAAPYAAGNPGEARRIAEWVEEQLPPSRRRRAAGASAALVRARLLEPARIAREFGRDEVMILDGWVLARSEAAAAIYLHALAADPGLEA